jgi:hypothetical protein
MSLGIQSRVSLLWRASTLFFNIAPQYVQEEPDGSAVFMVNIFDTVPEDIVDTLAEGLICSRFLNEDADDHDQVALVADEFLGSQRFILVVLREGYVGPGLVAECIVLPAGTTGDDAQDFYDQYQS